MIILLTGSWGFWLFSGRGVMVFCCSVSVVTLYRRGGGGLGFGLFRRGRFFLGMVCCSCTRLMSACGVYRFSMLRFDFMGFVCLCS